MGVDGIETAWNMILKIPVDEVGFGGVLRSNLHITRRGSNVVGHPDRDDELLPVLTPPLLQVVDLEDGLGALSVTTLIKRVFVYYFLFII